MDQRSNKRPLLRRIIAFAMVIIVWAIVVFVVVEGISSTLLFGRELGRLRGRGELAERQHTKHDALLGWVAEPNTYLPNAYGEGVYVRINGQGFRDNDDVPAEGAGRPHAGHLLGRFVHLRLRRQ